MDNHIGNRGGENTVELIIIIIGNISQTFH